MINCSIKNISKLVSSGLTPLRSKAEFWCSQDIPWVKTEQLGIKNIYESNEKISKLALNKTSIKLNPINTISVAMYGEGKTRGSVSILRKEMTTNQACCNIVIDEKKANYEYVYYFLKTQYSQLRGLSSGVRKNLNSNDIKNFVIRLPENLIHQNKIAKVLSDLDAKIEVNNKINKELEAMAKTLYDYWFVQFDFPNANAKPYKSSGGEMVFNEALKREIPNGWEVKIFSDVLFTVNESIEPDDYPNLNYLPIDKLPSNQLYYQEYSNRENANSSLVRFEEDDILLGAMRVYFHRVCNAIEDGISRSTIMVLRAYEQEFKNYGLLTLNRNEAIKFANKNSTGSSIPYAKWDNGLANYKVVIPEKNLLKKLDDFLNPILNEFKVLSKENQKLTEIRDWLLPMLMNGQVTVTEA